MTGRITGRMTAPDPEPAPLPRPLPLPSARAVLRACLLAQVLVAGAVALDTGWGALDRIGRDGIRTETQSPISPGDQRRPFSPSAVPSRLGPEQPSEGPVRLPDPLPDRLEFSIRPTEAFGDVLLLAGAIDPGAAPRLRGYLADLDAPPDMVALHSPGGSVRDALDIGRMLRDDGLNTLVLPDAACLSACPYIFAGGVERTASRTAWIGLHQHAYDDGSILPAFLAVEQIQAGQGETLRYLSDMGVDPLALARGLETPPDDIYLLVEEELLRYRLATAMID